MVSFKDFFDKQIISTISNVVFYFYFYFFFEVLRISANDQDLTGGRLQRKDSSLDFWLN